LAFLTIVSFSDERAVYSFSSLSLSSFRYDRERSEDLRLD
jgi:hypothetical protein